MIDAATRLHGVEQLIDMEQYFVIHAARQSGKTTFLLNMVQQLNAEGECYPLYCSLENQQGVADAKEGIPGIIYSLKDALLFSRIPNGDRFAENANFSDYLTVVKTELTRFCISLDKPLVIFFDEADCLSEGTLISFLRQLRNGYNNRSTVPFVKSIALVGMCNIRDYKVHIRPDSETLGSASPFNIVAKALTLANFTKEEIEELYAQHTSEAGQIFEPDAIELVWKKTQGQPWLVNAIAREVIVELLDSDYNKPVTAELCDRAIQNIILRRDVHIDSLLERLKEPRVRRVIDPVIAGAFVDITTDDFSYTKDLGLIRVMENKRIEPANPIYAEVIVRTLNNNTQESLARTDEKAQMPRYLKDGKIDMDFLMRDFQQFWRKDSAIWEERYQYKEAAPHLILMAFLQRVINGGGEIIREMAAETGRIDLCVMYQNQKYPIELKIRYDSQTLAKGMEQTAGYMDILGCNEGWLCIFDRSPEKSWDEKIYMTKEKIDGGKTITIVGL
jgi:hypothetical protein